MEIQVVVVDLKLQHLHFSSSRESVFFFIGLTVNKIESGTCYTSDKDQINFIVSKKEKKLKSQGI